MIATTDEATQLSALIGDIYDTALDPPRWPATLETVVPFLGGAFGNLFAQDAAVKSGATFYSCGLPPRFIQDYYATYIKLNPLFPATLFFDAGRVIRIEEIIPHDEFTRTRFYKEWAKPLGWLDAIAAVLEKSAVSCSVFAVGRRDQDGRFDDDHVRRMQMLVPHVRRAMLIGNVIETCKTESQSLADVLDGIATALLLVDAVGRIVHANRRALEMLAENSVASGAGGRLMFADAGADRTLRDLFADASGGDAAVGTKGISVPLSTRDGARHVAHVLPLTSGARKKAGVAYSAVAAVFVRKASLDLPHPIETIADTFKLTPTEMRVLMMIVEIGGVPEVAPVLGVSETTVKTHLQHIYAKTGASRQADLVKLVASYMSPLAGAGG